jgi:aryl-alcohol dehydrogenase-like predicted oxidoreductase
MKQRRLCASGLEVSEICLGTLTLGVLKSFFKGRGKPLASVAVAWVLQQRGISAAIVGASRPDQLAAALSASELRFDDDERQVLDEVWFTLPRQRPASGLVR